MSEENVALCDRLFTCVEEVLAPVPSYDEYNELVQKMHILEERLEVSEKAHYKTLEQLRIATGALRIATNALKIYSKDDYYSEGGGRSVNPYPDIARKALKEMEGVE